MLALPIDPVLPALRAALREVTAAVLEAPPGAGKTTRVPLALLDEGWLGGQRIVMLEPRRLAARAAAARMAHTLGERVGQTVGYRVRMDTRVGADTRIEVVTEGVLTRMLVADPELRSVGLVVFDEFHERNLHGDVGLALALQTQAVLREDLRLLVMSATLEGAAIAALLGGESGAPVPVIRSEGRSFPVETHYLTQPVEARIEAAVAAVVRRALEATTGDILAFLPGVGEIRRTEGLLRDGGLPDRVVLAPLYGDLPQETQDRALAGSPPGTRKVVLATSIAETSLTIEGVRVVVDSGRARVPRFSPRSGMTGLATVRVSRASADQRRGRAGRTTPGICYRLWTAAEHARLDAHALPEIAQADLAPLALDLAAWGTADPAELAWLDEPPPAAFAAARDLLAELGALDAAGRLTAHGRRMATFPLHPRLAHMVLRADTLGLGALACEMAALLSGRDVFRAAPGGPPPDADFRLRLAALHDGHAAIHGATFDRAALAAARKEAQAWQQRLEREGQQEGRKADKQASRRAESEKREPDGTPGAGITGRARLHATSASDHAGLLLAFAYPDRIAQRRDRPGSSSGGPVVFRLRSGRGAVLPPDAPLGDAPFLAVADLDARPEGARVFLAAPLATDEIEAQFADRIETEDLVAWDAATKAVRARRVRRLGAVVLRDAPLAAADSAAVARALLDGVRFEGLSLLPWTKAAQGFRERVAFLRHYEGEAWPDFSDPALLATLDEWLGPHLAGMRRADDLARLDLFSILADALPWSLRSRMDALAPTHLAVPSGSRIPLDYADPNMPALAVRLQEVFGLLDTPRLAGGRVPVVLHLLSPAHRPVQVTRDLASFWARGYFEVRKDLRGRYPKHHWPDDPLAAAPTARAKRRG